MNNDIIHRVLWVEDDENLIESSSLCAEQYGLDLVSFTSWETAEENLRNHFCEYEAIILDAYCVTEQGGVMQDGFLLAVITRLSGIFASQKRVVPWYIYTAGTMNHFDDRLSYCRTQRKEYEGEWGQMLFYKDRPADDRQGQNSLFKTISEVVNNKARDIVLFRYADVLKYVGEDRLIKGDARKYLLNLLNALHAPESVPIGEEVTANTLRKVVEGIFEATGQYGLLDNRITATNGKSKYLAGITVEVTEGDKKVRRRWGYSKEENESGENDAVFDKRVSSIIKDVLEYTNMSSHMQRSGQESGNNSLNDRCLLFGYVLQICYVITWLGAYVKEHPNRDANLRNQRVVECFV